MTKIKYDENILNEYINRDNAVFIEAYYNKDLIKLNNLYEFNSYCFIKFKCKCNNIYIKIFRNILNTGFLCDICLKKDIFERKKKTYLERYGVESPLQSKEIKEKWKKTNLEKYGVEHTLQNKDIREKSKKTNLKKYGFEYSSQSQEIQEKIKKTTLIKYGVEHVLQNKEVIKKTKTTNLERYGVECSLQNKEVKDKIKQTNLEKYGVENPSQNTEIKNKKKATCLKNFGTEFPIQNKSIQDKIKNIMIQKYNVEYPSQNKEIRYKIKKVNLERYGVENPNQSQQIQEKTQKNAKKYKKYKFPSGDIRKVQGYESFALDELIKFYNEDEIKTNRKDIPKIKYKIDEKEKYYFPDIYIPHEKYIIEVKSTWTYKCKEDNIKQKAEATKLLGYKYEIWVYNAKGIKEAIIN
jgi:hypothetical protein